MSLSDDQLRRLARLARIALQPGETSAVAERLNRVLGLIDEMRRVDTRGIEPMAHAQDVTLTLRDDVVTASDQSGAHQRLAPSAADGLYLVPRVIE